MVLDSYIQLLRISWLILVLCDLFDINCNICSTHKISALVLLDSWSLVFIPHHRWVRMGPNALMLITNLVCVNCWLSLMQHALHVMYPCFNLFLHQVLVIMPLAYVFFSLTCCSYHAVRTLVLFGISPRLCSTCFDVFDVGLIILLSLSF